VSEGRERRLLVLDNQVGTISVNSRWARDSRTHTKGWRPKTRTELMDIRRMFLALRGRQVAFKIPRNTDDLVATQPLSSGANTIDVENTGFARYVVEDRQFRVTFTDGTTLVRSVTGSAELSADEERLTLNTTWPANRPVDEIARIDYIETARLATDRITILHGEYPGKAEIEVPVVEVSE
jgi:hypothetical protein